MLNIEYKENLDEEYYQIIDSEFNKFAFKNGVACNYKSFAFVAKENSETVGILIGNTYYKEIHIGDLIVYEQYRNKNVGTKLIEEVERYYKNKGFENVNLTTYNFQAPEFYKKCGFELEFVRENKENPKLDKYFFIKYL